MIEKKKEEKYDFKQLIASYPKLKEYTSLNKYGTLSIDFFDSEAVRALNYALLAHLYNIKNYSLPPHALIPPLPGRATYIEAIASLLPTNMGSKSVNVLDVGVGTNCIYPIIGVCAHGWKFVGSDIDNSSLEWCQKIIDANSSLHGMIELRLQPKPTQIFEGVVTHNDQFDLSICNPPFHDSLQSAEKATLRKLRNLKGERNPSIKLNFKGEAKELWCKGGEREFIKRMIEESGRFRTKVKWFTSLVSKEENLKPLTGQLTKIGVKEHKIIQMHLGNKTSHILAWRY